MYLLICTLEKDIVKESVISSIEDNESVESITWLSGEDGKKKLISFNPMVGGSINGLSKYEEQDVMLATIKDKDAIGTVVGSICSSGTSEDLNYYVVPLIS